MRITYIKTFNPYEDGPEAQTVIAGATNPSDSSVETSTMMPL